jgi:HK97 family phage major capsid protein
VKVSLVSLLVKKLACLTVINRELEEDAVVGLGEIVGVSITRSMAKKEDEIGFMGDGTEDYFGMTGIVGALLKIATDPATIPGLFVGAGNAYSELTLGDFRNVVGILPPDADDGAKWYMNKKFYYNVVYPLAEAAGVANIFEILSNQKGRFLLGYPVEFIHCMPYEAANSQICAILGAYLGERRAIEIARSTEVFFGNDQVCIRGTERIDINAHGVGDTTDAGAIVGLITKGS